jgi:hypothetical protein
VLFDIDNFYGKKDGDGNILKDAAEATHLIDCALKIFSALCTLYCAAEAALDERTCGARWAATHRSL